MNRLFIALLLLQIYLLTRTDCETIGTRKINVTQVSFADGELIPREEILNHALASADMALKHVKENWIPLFDENALLDDPTGSYEFKGAI